MPTKGQLAYEDRSRTGDKWGVVAQRADIPSPSAACAVAKKFARKNGLDWPITLPKKAPDPSEGVERAREDQRLYEFIASGRQYHEVPDLTVNQVYAALARHVERTGSPELPRNPQRAYEMRRADPSLPWKDIQKVLGYKNVSHVQEAARLYAQATGQEWPLGSR